MGEKGGGCECKAWTSILMSTDALCVDSVYCFLYADQGCHIGHWRGIVRRVGDGSTLVVGLVAGTNSTPHLYKFVKDSHSSLLALGASTLPWRHVNKNFVSPFWKL